MRKQGICPKTMNTGRRTPIPLVTLLATRIEKCQFGLMVPYNGRSAEDICCQLRTENLNLDRIFSSPSTRREFLARSGTGLGAVGLATLLEGDRQSANANSALV